MGRTTKTTAQQKLRQKVLQTVLTWSHVMTMSILILAALSHFSGLAAILFKPEIATIICEYVRSWQTFFTAGILGYDAKSTIENALKIVKDVRSATGEVEDKATDDESQNG